MVKRQNEFILKASSNQEGYNYALLQYSKRVEIKVYKTVATELKYCDKHIEEG